MIEYNYQWSIGTFSADLSPSFPLCVAGASIFMLMVPYSSSEKISHWSEPSDQWDLTLDVKCSVASWDSYPGQVSFLILLALKVMIYSGNTKIFLRTPMKKRQKINTLACNITPDSSIASPPSEIARSYIVWSFNFSLIIRRKFHFAATTK